MRKLLATLALLAGMVWTQPENLFVTPTGAGSANGSSWSNAFAGFSGITWGSGAGQLGAGDTLWIAGSATAYGGFTVGAAGTAGNPITLKRATTNDTAATSSPGWQASFDSTVTTSSTALQAIIVTSDNITFDGQRTNGWRVLGQRPWDGVSGDNTEQCSMFRIIANNIYLANIEAVGPGRQQQWYAGYHVGLTASGKKQNITLYRCDYHDGTQGLFAAYTDYITLDGCNFYRNFASGGLHNNEMYTDTCAQFVCKNSQLYNFSAVGLYFTPFNPGTDYLWIYNNIFGPSPAGSSGVGIIFDPNTAAATVGPHVYINCNDFSQLDGAGIRTVARFSGPAVSGGQIYDNIFFNGGQISTGTSPFSHDYNWFTTADAYTAIEPHAIIGGAVNPFQNVGARDFRIVANIGSTYPRQKGTNLGSLYQLDRAGNSRGTNSVWDIGALAYITAGQPTTPSNVSPANGATSVSLTPTLAASAYANPSGSAFGSSIWYIYPASSTNIVWQSGILGPVTNATVPSLTLNYSTTYRWAVQYADINGLFSSQSILTSFTTTNAPTPTTYVLNLTSSTPSSGALITVTPTDNNGQGSGSTAFTRTYNSGSVVGLTAAASAGGNNFQKWQKDGSDVTTNQVTSVTMDAAHTMTAVYVATPPPTTFTLTVNSSNPSSGATVSVSPLDQTGQGAGVTSFTRSYVSGTNVVLTAAATAGGNVFSKWQRDGSDVTTNLVTTTTMSAAHTNTAVYVSAPPPATNILIFSGAGTITLQGQWKSQ